MKRGVQSNLRELSITILESFRRLRKFSGGSNSRTRRFTPAKTPSESDGQGLSSRANARDLRKISPFGRNDNAFFPLRPLRLCGKNLPSCPSCHFVVKIIFCCFGFVAALPRWVSAVNTPSQ